MRISTPLIYTLGAEAIERQQVDLFETQQQIASGRRILTPSDDPVAAAQALNVTHAKDQTEQYSTNVNTAKSALALNDSVLSQVTDLLQSVRTLAVNGGNASLNNNDRGSIATDIAGQLQQLIGLANSKDGNGGFLFSGFQVNTQPFVSTATGVLYNGDQGQLQLQVAPARALAISENGSATFEQVNNGNGIFVASAAATNGGSGVVSAGQVVSPSAMTGDTYQIQFSVAGGITTYDVIDTTTSSTVSTGNAYTDGAAIAVAGMQVTISGAPASGDQFTLAPSSHQSIFTTVQNLIATLQTQVSGASGAATVANGISTALQNLDQALETVLTTRAGIGARLRELDALAAGNDDRTTQYQQTLSQLQDLDYNKALSDFARQQLALEAAQKSFAHVSGLSLFNYL